jgi:hypothetical protein
LTQSVGFYILDAYLKSHHEERTLVSHGELSILESSDGYATKGKAMRVLSVFTVSCGVVRHGADIERHVLPSTRAISAIVIGASDKPAYVQVNDIPLREKGGRLAPEVRAAGIVRKFPWTPELISVSEANIDKAYAIVVLRTDVGRENYHRGKRRNEPLPGWTLAKGRIRPCRENRLGKLWLGRGAVQLVQCVPFGSVFSTIVNYDDGSQVVHSYVFNGETIELVPPEFPWF